MSFKQTSYLDHLKISLPLSICLGCLMGILILISMPFFLDNLLDLAIFCLLIPSALGIIAALVFVLFQRVIPSVNRSLEKPRLSLLYVVSFFLFIVALSFGGFIYLLVSDSLIIQFLLILIFLVFWVLVLSRISRVEQSRFCLSNKQLSIAATCLFIGSIVVFTSFSYYRNFKFSPRVVIFGIDAATWYIMNPLLEKGLLPNLARLKREGSYGTLRSIEPTLSPIVWTTIATGKIAEKHGIKDFYSSQESIRTRRIWDEFQANGMSVGIFKWLITWPPRKVYGFIIPDILARDPTTFPPEYSAINSLRIAEKSHDSRDVRTYAKLSWSLMNIGLRMSTLREIGRDFFVSWLSGGDDVSQYPLVRKAELLINKDVFTYLLKKYQPQFVTFYDNGVDTLSHKYWKYYEPDNFPDTKPDEVRRYGKVIPDYYELVDRTLGSLMSHFSDDTLVVIVSDHGQRAATKVGSTEYYPKLSELLQLMGLDSVVYGIALGGRSYIRLKEPSQTELLFKAIKQFEEIRVVETGRALYDIIPDNLSFIVEIKGDAVDFNNHVRVGQKEFKMEQLTYETPPESGVHSIDGIVIMKGPNVGSGIKISGASILDITPTILYLERMPISEEIDGKVLYSAILNDFQKANSARFVPESDLRKVNQSQKSEFDKNVEERLKSLGYVQ